MSARSSQKLSKLRSKNFDRSVYLNEYKTISDIKITTSKYRCLLESNFVEVNRLFVLVYSNKDANAKRFNVRRYCSPKDIIKNYNVIINGKKFYGQTIDLDIQRYKEIRKVTTGEDYTSGCLLYYDYVKNHSRLAAFDLSSLN